MKRDHLQGYLFPEIVRKMQRYAVPVGAILFAAFVGFLWYVAIIFQNKTIGFCFAGFWTACFLRMLWRQYINRGLCYIEYQCAQDGIVNLCTRGENRIEFKDGYFIMTVCYEFAIGKGIKELEFYVFSKAPFQTNAIFKKGGLSAVKKVWEHQLVILPVTEQTKDWIAEHLPMKQTPKMYKAFYIPPSSHNNCV